MPLYAQALFKPQDLTFFHDCARSKYRADNPKNVALGHELRSRIFDTTRYWAALMQQHFGGNFTFDFDNSWQTGQSLNRYSWARLYPDGNEAGKVFFTIGADSGKTPKGENDRPPQLVWKLDCWHSGSNGLPAYKVHQFRQFASDHKLVAEAWRANQLKDKTWDDLVKTVASYMHDHMELYREAQRETHAFSFEHEPRIARVTWNTNGWERPSGPEGKSPGTGKYNHPYETANGFGHEEWLFNTDHSVNGWQYGFLEPVHKRLKGNYGKCFHLFLYTRDETGQRYWVAEIPYVEVLSKKQAKKAAEALEKTGGIEQMHRDLVEAIGEKKAATLHDWEPHQLFNVRFRFDTLDNFDGEPIPFHPDDKNIKIDRYELFHLQHKLQLDGRPAVAVLTGGVDSDGLTGKDKRTTGASAGGREFANRHLAVQKALGKALEREYRTPVLHERQKANGTQIDTWLTHNNETWFIEVKSYNSVLTSIRVALGQLLEYAYHPNGKIADRLIVASDMSGKRIAPYIDVLRAALRIELHYIEVAVGENHQCNYSAYPPLPAP